MDPLVLLAQAESKGTLPKAVAKKATDRMSYLRGAVERVEKASGLRYPPYYIEPVLPVSETQPEYGQMGVLFARVIPTTATGSLAILVQFTAALLAFGAKGTVDAVAAHEFTHYVELVRKLSRMDVASDERAETLFEATYADSERTVSPKLIFKDKALVTLIGRKFKPGLLDERLNKQVSEKWVAKGLPMRVVPPEDNVVKLALGSVISTSFDPELMRRLGEFEGKSKS